MSAAEFVNGLIKQAEDGDARQQAKTRADELLNMNSTGGMLADYLTPSLWGGARAGRATQLAQAAGRDVPFSVKHPNTSDVSALLAGGAGGAVLGGMAGAAMDSGPDGFPLGAALGGGLGGLASLLAMRSRRRSRMGQIRQAAEDELASGNPLKPVDPNLGTASSVLLPFGGSHRAGQADAYEALRDDAKYPNMTGRNVAYALAPLIGGSPLGMPYEAGMGAYQGLNAQSRVAGKQQNGFPELTRKAAAVTAWLSDERRREKQGGFKLADTPHPSLRAAVLASPILAGLGVGGALAYGAHSAPRGREWHGAGSTYAQTAGTLGGAGAGSVLGGLVGGGLGAAAGLSRADLARAMLAGGGLGGLGGGYAGNRLSAALHPGPAQLGLGDRDGDERRREKQGGFKLANTPPAPALPEDPQHPSVMSSRPPAPALPEDSPQVSTAGSSRSIGPVPMGAGYSPYASIESPEFNPKLPELPMGERTWQQFGQGIGKQIYNNPVPYALGAGAAGLGLYGLHNMMQQPRRKRRYEEA